MDWEHDRKSNAGDGKRLLRISEVATSCSVSARTVYRWIERDGLPVHRIPGAGVREIRRISAEDLDEWLSHHRYDLAAANASTQQTLQLNGRRFISSIPAETNRKNRLDMLSCSRSRARPTDGKER